MNTCETMEVLTLQFSWVLPSHRNYLSNTSEGLGRIKRSLIITNSSLYSCQDNSEDSLTETVSIKLEITVEASVPCSHHPKPYANMWSQKKIPNEHWRFFILIQTDKQTFSLLSYFEVWRNMFKSSFINKKSVQKYSALIFICWAFTHTNTVNVHKIDRTHIYLQVGPIHVFHISPVLLTDCSLP